MIKHGGFLTKLITYVYIIYCVKYPIFDNYTKLCKYIIISIFTDNLNTVFKPCKTFPIYADILRRNTLNLRRTKNRFWDTCIFILYIDEVKPLL